MLYAFDPNYCSLTGSQQGYSNYCSGTYPAGATKYHNAYKNVLVNAAEWVSQTSGNMQ
jgi:hypothetical protein